MVVGDIEVPVVFAYRRIARLALVEENFFGEGLAVVVAYESRHAVAHPSRPESFSVGAADFAEHRLAVFHFRDGNVVCHEYQVAGFRPEKHGFRVYRDFERKSDFPPRFPAVARFEAGDGIAPLAPER